MSQCLVRSDTVIFEAATHCPVDELVLTFHIVYRHSSVCQLTARLYLGHLKTPHHWSQWSLTERRSCKHIVNLSGVNGSQADGQHMGPTNRSCKPAFTLWSATIGINSRVSTISTHWLSDYFALSTTSQFIQLFKGVLDCCGNVFFTRNCRTTEYFPEKSSWCQNEHVCQQGKA